MPKFRRKPEIIDTVQFKPGVPIDGVEQVDPTLIFSRDNNHYYLQATFFKDEQKVLPNAWVPNPAGDGGDVLPFVFWDVKSGHKRKAMPDEALVKRYLAYMGVEHFPESYGILKHPDRGLGTIVEPGCWVLTDSLGVRSVCSAVEFDLHYEPVEG